MGKQHMFRFGIINEHMTSREAWLAGARRAEELGYATFLIRDHFAPDFFGDQFAPFAALMAAAMATSTLRVGTLVIDNDYRHPVVLAKESATLDMLSGGRFELGLGAGWLRSEYAQAGMTYDAAGVRVGRLAEAVRVIKGLFGGEPLLIGGGHQRVLTLAGREADIVGILTSSVASGTLTQDPQERLPAAVAQKIGWVRQGAGERFDALELSLVPSFILSADRRQAAADYIRSCGWAGICVEQALAMPSLFIGTLDQIADDMLARRAQYGFSYYVIADDQREALAPLVARLAGR